MLDMSNRTYAAIIFMGKTFVRVAHVIRCGAQKVSLHGLAVKGKRNASRKRQESVHR